MAVTVLAVRGLAVRAGGHGLVVTGMVVTGPQGASATTERVRRNRAGWSRVNRRIAHTVDP